ncbi:pyridoxal-phosphate dependent enzyme [Candidatus Poribacteria bacterium]|nr:pyridoxal-phosphate dependent enzyme [Candidatus Poribacteria bacterium]
MSEIQLRPAHGETNAAARVIAQHVEPTPLKKEKAFSESLNADIYVKYEFLSPVKSFKIRGALNLACALANGKNVSRVITVSTGNHGAAMAFACREYNLQLTVGVPVNCDQSKLELIRQFGGELEMIGRDLDETKELLQQRPLSPDTVFIEDGSSPEIVAGTSTIGSEIVQQLPNVEVVIVPVGNGALIGGIGTALKEFNPAIQVIGGMALSFEAGHAVDTESCDTFASGMAVRVSIPEAVDLMLAVVDKMHMVSETELKEAMGTFYNHTGHLPEGAGVAPLATALKMRTGLENKTVCLIASGANVDDTLRQEIKEKFV